MSQVSPRNRDRTRRSREGDADGPIWIWGAHAVAAAIANPRRRILRLTATDNARRRLDLGEAEAVSAREIDRLLPPGAVHQGVAAHVDALEPTPLEALLEGPAQRLAVLDQVSDPHNLGAVFRSAAAFGFGALVLQSRHAPPISGVVSKSAAGAVETVAECRVVNIARALDALAEAGWTSIGLAGAGNARLADVVDPVGRTAIVLGAEGAGLRPAVAKACGVLARIPIDARMESLNVSNAAAIAFYEASRGAF